MYSTDEGCFAIGSCTHIPNSPQYLKSFSLCFLEITYYEVSVSMDSSVEFLYHIYGALESEARFLFTVFKQSFLAVVTTGST